MGWGRLGWAGQGFGLGRWVAVFGLGFGTGVDMVVFLGGVYIW